MEEKEIWKNIKKIEGQYKISNLGNIKNCATGTILSSSNLRGGYKSVVLNATAYKIHRLVAQAFIENDDETKNVVNHIDGNKLNNRADNLEWTTLAENTRLGYITGKNKVTKRAVYQINKDTDEIIKKFESLQDARLSTKIDDGSICKVCKGRQNTAGGYKWKFVDENPNECDLDLSDFKEVKNFPNYKISKEGIVYSMSFKKILKQQINADGYKVISLANNKNKKSFLVHRLVAEHFIKKIDGKDFVNHIDSNKINSHVDNLEWVTCSENLFHAKNKIKNNKTNELQTPKLVSKDIDGSGEKSEVKEKRLKSKENPQPSV
jgi:hypothetical protein